MTTNEKNPTANAECTEDTKKLQELRKKRLAEALRKNLRRRKKAEKD